MWEPQAPAVDAALDDLDPGYGAVSQVTQQRRRRKRPPMSQPQRQLGPPDVRVSARLMSGAGAERRRAAAFAIRWVCARKPVSLSR